MIPAARLIFFAIVWLCIALLVSVYPTYTDYWIYSSYALVGITIADIIGLYSYPSLSSERQVMTALSLGTWNNVTLTLHNPATFAQRLEVFDHHPVDSEQEGLPYKIRIPGKSWGQITYRVNPLKRGLQHFSKTQIHIYSPLGLWKRNRKIGEMNEVRVYPNFASVMKYSLLATDQRLSQMGILKKRRRGEGLEFHQLREFRDGDSLRQVDWKATARTRKLISRDYQEERDQQIIFLIDCGRRMLAHDGDLSHFDHTLNATLLLSHVALRQGDAVGLMTFSGDDRWISPRKSIASVNHILNTIYDLQPGLKTPDYTTAATNIMHRQHRRALIILITNLRDEDTGELIPALNMLKRRHLVLLASMQERAITDILDNPIDNFDNAMEYAAAQQYLTYRRAAHQTIQQSGVLQLDVAPDQLPISIVNRYLEIKSSGQL